MHSGALVLGDACLAAAAAHGFSDCECSCFFLPTAVMLQQGWSATITPYPFRVIFCSVFVVDMNVFGGKGNKVSFPWERDS